MSQRRRAIPLPSQGLFLVLAVVAIIVAQWRPVVLPEEDWLRCAVAHIQAEAERAGKPVRLSEQKAPHFSVSEASCREAGRWECDPADLVRYLKNGGDGNASETWSGAQVDAVDQTPSPTELEVRMSSLFHLDSAGPEIAYFCWRRGFGQGRSELGIIELRIGSDGRPLVSAYHPLEIRWHCH